MEKEVIKIINKLEKKKVTELNIKEINIWSKYMELYHLCLEQSSQNKNNTMKSEKELNKIVDSKELTFEEKEELLQEEFDKAIDGLSSVI